jgi:hypothetical protein
MDRLTSVIYFYVLLYTKGDYNMAKYLLQYDPLVCTPETSGPQFQEFKDIMILIKERDRLCSDKLGTNFKIWQQVKVDISVNIEVANA